MNAARRFTLIFILLFAGCQSRPSASTLPTNQDNVAVIASDAELVRSIGESNGTEQISADNSLVIIRTPAIERIVERGPAILPELIRYMKTPDLDFDHFIRCYSASDQILQNVDSNASVYWQGNCAAEEMPDGSMRFRPGSQPYNKTFRDRVIADIERKFSRVLTGA